MTPVALASYVFSVIGSDVVESDSYTSRTKPKITCVAFIVEGRSEYTELLNHSSYTGKFPFGCNLRCWKTLLIVYFQHEDVLHAMSYPISSKVPTERRGRLRAVYGAEHAGPLSSV
jgi:hypothetical protein